MDTRKIEEGVRLILEGVGEDPDREGLRETPARVARMYGVAVVMEAEHLCMSMRGVKKPGSRTVTSAVRGVFAGSTPASRASRSEAMSLILRDAR